MNVNANVKFWTYFSANASASGKDLRERGRSSKTLLPDLVHNSLVPKKFSARKIPKISRIPNSGVGISGWGGTLYFREFRDSGFVPEPKFSLNIR